MSNDCDGKDIDRIILPRYSDCFVCGKKNPIGLDMTFCFKNNRIETSFLPREEHGGYKDVVHGGILATLLDETMGWTSIISRPILCFAADLSVRYKAPAKVGERMFIYGELVKDKRRVIMTKGRIETEDGSVLCTGEGKYIPLPKEEQDEFIVSAHWGDALERAYDRIRALNKL